MRLRTHDQCKMEKSKDICSGFIRISSEELMKDAKTSNGIDQRIISGRMSKNPLLQFEGCCILGEDEQLADEIDSYELWVLEFGADREDPEFQTH